LILNVQGWGHGWGHGWGRSDSIDSVSPRHTEIAQAVCWNLAQSDAKGLGLGDPGNLSPFTLFRCFLGNALPAIDLLGTGLG